MGSDVPAPLYGILKEHLQNNDKQVAIDLYYELISSGHSVGDILNAIGPFRSNSEHDTSAILHNPQLTAHGEAANRASKIGVVGAEQANAQDTDGLSLFD